MFCNGIIKDYSLDWLNDSMHYQYIKINGEAETDLDLQF